MDMISLLFHVEWSEKTIYSLMVPLKGELEGKKSLKENLSLERLLIHEYSCKDRQVVGLFMLSLFKKESIKLVHEVHELEDVARGSSELNYQFGFPSWLCWMWFPFKVLIANILSKFILFMKISKWLHIWILVKHSQLILTYQFQIKVH